ncbi:MAG: hypothetical protein JNN11_04160 [Candidatus Doudnabacteria bacterium]|nr:hypothetical protein [Candidatus Doudnabacteria bacterium]
MKSCFYSISFLLTLSAFILAPNSSSAKILFDNTPPNRIFQDQYWYRQATQVLDGTGPNLGNTGNNFGSRSQLASITVYLKTNPSTKETYGNCLLYARVTTSGKNFFSTNLSKVPFSALPTDEYKPFTFAFDNTSTSTTVNFAGGEKIQNIFIEEDYGSCGGFGFGSQAFFELGGTDQNPSNILFWYADPSTNFTSSNVMATRIEDLENTKIPILFIPGILGTEIAENDELLWANPKMTIPANSDNFMDPLSFTSLLKPTSNSTRYTNVIKTISATIGGIELELFDYTSGLISEFTDQGYTENQNFFTFPYDWRYGVSGIIDQSNNKTNVNLLQEKITEILNITGSNKINIIAHSNGGLLLKKYVLENPSSHSVNKAVLLGVPNTGAPKAIKVLLEGDNFGVVGLSDEEMKKIALNLPVVYDLTPSQTYYNAKGSFYNLTQEKFLKPPTTQDLNFNEVWDNLLNQKGYNQTAFENSALLHSPEFDNADLRNYGIDLYNIVGCKKATLGKIQEYQYTNLLGETSTSYKAPIFVPGDGTVPLESATNLPTSQNNKFYALKADHGKMPSQNGIRQKVVNILTDSSLETPSLSQNESDCKLNGRAISVYSPVNIEAYDQMGNRAGFAEDGSVENNIPNAELSIFGHVKFIFLPEDENQVYNIRLKGTGEGTFTLTSLNIENNAPKTTEVFSNIPVTMNLKAELNTEDSKLTLDTDGNNMPDQTINPSSVLSPETATDILPPVSTSTIVGTKGNENFYLSNILVLLSATDTISSISPASDILKINYQLDNSPWQSASTSSISLEVTQETEHVLKFFSTDKAGNNEAIKQIKFTIDKTPPEFLIGFNLTKKDLEFKTQNTLDTLQDQDSRIVATDKAGNKAEILFKEKNRKQNSRAEIIALSYNNKSANITKTVFKTSWNLDKKGVLKSLEQHARSKKDFNLELHFENNKTKLTGRDQHGKINKILTGLKTFELKTLAGDFEWNILP